MAIEVESMLKNEVALSVTVPLSSCIAGSKASMVLQAQGLISYLTMTIQVISACKNVHTCTGKGRVRSLGLKNHKLETSKCQVTSQALATSECCSCPM